MRRGLDDQDVMEMDVICSSMEIAVCGNGSATVSRNRRRKREAVVGWRGALEEMADYEC